MMQTKASGLAVSFQWSIVKSCQVITPPRSRCKHATCLHNDYVYMVGGKDGNVPLREFWRFHIGECKWEKVTYRGSPLPYLEGCSLVSHKRLLLLFGGGFQDDQSESCLWIVNPDLEHIRRFWADAGSVHPGERRHHSSVVYDNTMYVYGGYINLKGSNAELWAFHIDDEEWELIPPSQRLESTPGCRHGHTAVVYGREMWLLGGMTDLSAKSDFWHFSFHSQRWQRIKLKFSPPPIVGHSCSVIKDNMVVFGGEVNGELSNDIWVFSFCSMRWSRVQVSGICPSVRNWHSSIPITAVSLKGDNSVRTGSMPYLQNKGQVKKLRRPKSSPAYSSARNRIRPDSETAQGSQHSKNSFNGITKAKPAVCPNDLSVQSAVNFSIVMTTPKETVKEDVSPLLYNRQHSTSSVTSTGSQRGGLDNPALDMASSVERIYKENSAEPLQHFYDLCEDVPKYAKLSCDKLPSASVGVCHVQNVNIRECQNRNVRQFTPTTNPFHEKSLPGQVMQNTPRRYIKRNGQKSTRLPGQIELVSFSEQKQKSPELVLEDLEQNTEFSPPGLDRQKLYHVDNRVHKASHSQSYIPPGFPVDHSGHFEMQQSCASVQEKQVVLSETKSLSLVNISETSFTDTSLEKTNSMIDMLPRRNSFHCWTEDTAESLSKSAGEENNLNALAEKCLKDNPQKTFGIQTSVTSGMDSTRQKPKSKCDNNQIKGQNQSSSHGNHEELSDVELDTPFFLLLGGKEQKGSNLRIEPLTVWKCNVYVRHSDISHGQFQKSSLVI